MNDDTFLDRLLEISNNGIRSIELINNRINLIEDLLSDLKGKIDGNTQPGIAENLRTVVRELEIVKQDTKNVSDSLKKFKEDNRPFEKIASLETDMRNIKKIIWTVVGIVGTIAGKLIYEVIINGLA